MEEAKLTVQYRLVQVRAEELLESGRAQRLEPPAVLQEQASDQVQPLEPAWDPERQGLGQESDLLEEPQLLGQVEEQQELHRAELERPTLLKWIICWF